MADDLTRGDGGGQAWTSPADVMRSLCRPCGRRACQAPARLRAMALPSVEQEARMKKLSAIDRG